MTVIFIFKLIKRANQYINENIISIFKCHTLEIFYKASCRGVALLASIEYLHFPHTDILTPFLQHYVKDCNLKINKQCFPNGT